MVDFVIPGTPIAKPKVRSFYNRNTGNMHHYYKNDKELKSFENLVRIKAEEFFKKPLSGPISLSVHFLMPRPKAMMWKRKGTPRVPSSKKPDIDNLIKTVEDALNGVAYNDDGQIAALHVWKDYHSGDEGPKTIIRIEEIDETS